MTRTLIMRDLAEPATPGAFDASVDRYTGGSTVPTLGTVQGTWDKRPGGPCENPATDDGWSFKPSVGAYYDKYLPTAQKTAFQLSEWYYIDSMSSSSTAHFWIALQEWRDFGAGALNNFLKIRADRTIKGNIPGVGTDVDSGHLVPLREWFELSMVYHAATVFNKYLMRRAGESEWTELFSVQNNNSPTLFVRGGTQSQGTHQMSCRCGGISLYSIDAVADALVVDDSIAPPPKRRRNWYVNAATGNDNNLGDEGSPWLTISKANTEMDNLGIMPTDPDSTGVDAAMVAIRDAAVEADYAALDESLETALDAHYADCDVLHIGNADFADTALVVTQRGMVVTGDGGEPAVRATIPAAAWSTTSRANVYSTPCNTANVLWEDNKWLGIQLFTVSESATLDALALRADGTFHCDNSFLYLKTDINPATSGRVYTRSRYRSTSGLGTSAILVQAKDVQVRDVTIRGTALADRSSGDGIQAYCLQWGDQATGICEARDIVPDKGGKHILGVTTNLNGGTFLRRRVTYGTGTPYTGSYSTDVDFSGATSSTCRAYYYDCEQIAGTVGVVGSVDGNPLVGGKNFYESHGQPWDFMVMANCRFGRGSFFDQGLFQGTAGLTLILVDSGGGLSACDTRIDRCKADYMPFGIWTGSSDCVITNSLIIPRISVTANGFSTMTGSLTVQGCTIDCRENISSDNAQKSIWNGNSATGTIDFHGNLIINSASKSFGIIASGENKTISCDRNVYLYPGTARLSTVFDSSGSWDTWAEWQARGHDANSINVNSDFGLAVGADYVPEYYSPIVEWLPIADVPLLVGTDDYAGVVRPDDLLTVGALEMAVGLQQVLDRLDSMDADINTMEATLAAFGTGNNITWTSPADQDGNVEIRRARDYNNTDGLAVEFTNVDGTWADLTGATVNMLVARPGQVVAAYSFPVSVVTPTGANQKVRLELTADQLAIEANDYVGEVVATLASGRKVTLTEGSFEVLLGREEPV